jgi:hypothetical protein
MKVVNVRLTNDNELRAVIIIFGHKYYVAEKAFYSPCGAVEYSFNIYKYKTEKSVYFDCCHNGQGSWQMNQNTRKPYSTLTEYIVRVLKTYLREG